VAFYHQNFFETGSHIRPQDANNCCIVNARLLGNGRYYGNWFTTCAWVVPSGYNNFVIITGNPARTTACQYCVYSVVQKQATHCSDKREIWHRSVGRYCIASDVMHIDF